MRARDAITDHPDLYRIWDTATLRSGDDIPGIGREDNGAIITYHVTDDPERALVAIKKRADLSAAYGPKGSHAELGPGLYASAVPDYWISRARRKWDFLPALTRDQTHALVVALRERVRRDSRWYAHGELERAERDLDLVERGVYDATALLFLASQPYAIPFYKDEILAPLGIKGGPTPSVLTLRVRGRFAELRRSYPDPALLRMLRRAGVSGAFTRAGMGTNPEIVIWNVHAIERAELGAQERAPRVSAAEDGERSLWCLGTDVGFVMRKPRRTFDASPAHGLLYDPSGRHWPKCSLLVAPFREGEIVDVGDTHAAAYFGKGARVHRGPIVLPTADAGAWDELGELHQVFYTRTGTRAPGDYKHPFGEPKGMLRVVALLTRALASPVILSELDGAYRIDMPKGCIVDDRGIVLP